MSPAEDQIQCFPAKYDYTNTVAAVGDVSMLPVTPHPISPSPAAPSPPTLWRDLADGSAGWVIRLLVTLALAAALGGLVPILAYFMAVLNPSWNRSPTYGARPTDELLAFLSVFAAAAFLAGAAWLWSRSGRRRVVLAPTVLTIGAIAATIVLGVLVEENLPGDQELVVLGLVALAGSAIILIWVQAFRRRGPRWRSLHNPQDGMPDVLCPSCGYRMVGLTESRCPECGTVYTLDELIAKQGFAPATPPPPAPPIMRSA